MELHPVWEKGHPLNPELWYVLSALGDAPSMRVGHTASYMTGGASSDGKVYFIAGANPDGQLAEVYTLDLETFSWDIIDCKDFKARYEHVAFTPDSDPSKVYILLGAEKTGSINDIQVFDTSNNEWESLVVSGSPPSPRTHHTTAQLGDRIYIYSGGEHGSEPVLDTQVYCFDSTSSTWSSIETEDPPQPRHGHILLAYNNKIILHGGMSGQTFFDDLNVLDLGTKKWRNIKPRKIFPSARAAHGGTVVGSNAYVFGGMGRHGAVDDLFRLDLETFKWQRVTSQGPAPTPRLDFAMTSITARIPIAEGQSMAEQTRDALEKLEGLRVEENSESGSARSKHELTVNDSPPGVAVPHPTPNTERYGTVSLLLVHGGMDTDGELWDDTLIFLVDSE